MNIRSRLCEVFREVFKKKFSPFWRSSQNKINAILFRSSIAVNFSKIQSSQLFWWSSNLFIYSVVLGLLGRQTRMGNIHAYINKRTDNSIILLLWSKFAKTYKSDGNVSELLFLNFRLFTTWHCGTKALRIIKRLPYLPFLSPEVLCIRNRSNALHIRVINECACKFIRASSAMGHTSLQKYCNVDQICKPLECCITQHLCLQR